MSEEQSNSFKKSIERAKVDKRKQKKMRIWKGAGIAVAAAMFALVILPNTSAGIAHAMGRIPFVGELVQIVLIRDYRYESDTHSAEINVPQLAMYYEENGVSDNGIEECRVENGICTLAVEETTSEINRETEELMHDIIKEFESSLEEAGYKEVIVRHEVVPSTERYFVLKLMHSDTMASNVEYHFYYTIDLFTGERVKLGDLFARGTDYMSVISDEIKIQMRQQMAKDPAKEYWIGQEMEEMNFESISEETQFYINEFGNVVISFQEGDVAPMSMGIVTFEIPGEVLMPIYQQTN